VTRSRTPTPKPTPPASAKPASAKPANAGPFAALAPLRDALPAGVSPPPAVAKPAPAPVGPARAVVRFEKKGRRGKQVTVIEQLGLGPAALEEWARALKGALGTGGAVEDDTIVLQGDVRTRIEPLLAARGVRKITIA
jgi:translation initiation factor 1